MSNDSEVKVFARFRPLNAREKEEQNDRIKFAFSSDHKSVHMGFQLANQHGASSEKKMDFACDRVFDMDSTQEEVFDELAKGMVEEVVKGYNATIFAYGQTGSGKTHCMFGPSKKKSELGIIPRSADHLFEVLRADPDVVEATIKISLLEIYNETIKDLFLPKDEPLKIRETPLGASYVAGLHEEYVANGEELMALLEIGSANRATSATMMNKASSRSHCVLIVVVSTKTRDGSVRTGKLNLADLAGSEKVKATGATGQTLSEAKKINSSLSALGNCIHALTDEHRSHVPYRDSKLTYLLKDSLGGNTKTALIVACSPAARNGEETYGTLQFAQRAKLVKNNVSVNSELSVSQLTEMVESLKKQIAELKSNNPDASAEIIEKLKTERDSLIADLTTSKDEKSKIEEEFKNYKAHVQKHWTECDTAIKRQASALKRPPSMSRAPSAMRTNALLSPRQHDMVLSPSSYNAQPPGDNFDPATPLPSSTSSTTENLIAIENPASPTPKTSSSPTTSEPPPSSSVSASPASSSSVSSAPASQATTIISQFSNTEEIPKSLTPKAGNDSTAPQNIGIEKSVGTDPANVSESTSNTVSVSEQTNVSGDSSRESVTQTTAKEQQNTEEVNVEEKEACLERKVSDSDAGDDDSEIKNGEHTQDKELSEFEEQALLEDADLEPAQVGDVGELLSANVRLEKENETLKMRVIELNRQVLEMKLRHSEDAPKIIKPITQAENISAIDIIQGKHVVDMALEERLDPIVQVTVRSCGASMDLASAALINKANNFLQRWKWLKSSHIQNLRHHWVELDLGEAGFVLVQKHPNGNITADFTTDAGKVRELALDVAGIHCRHSAAFEDVAVEGEVKDLTLTVSDVILQVKKQPPKYRSLTINSKDFAFQIFKWCKQAGKKINKSQPSPMMKLQLLSPDRRNSLSLLTNRKNSLAETMGISAFLSDSAGTSPSHSANSTTNSANSTSNDIPPTDVNSASQETADNPVILHTAVSESVELRSVEEPNQNIQPQSPHNEPRHESMN